MNTNLKMEDDLRNDIASTYDGGMWEEVTSKLFTPDSIYQLFKFEHDCEFEGKIWRCLILKRVFYDTYDAENVDYCEDVYTDAFEI